MDKKSENQSEVKSEMIARIEEEKKKNLEEIERVFLEKIEKENERIEKVEILSKLLENKSIQKLFPDIKEIDSLVMEMIEILNLKEIIKSKLNVKNSKSKNHGLLKRTNPSPTFSRLLKLINIICTDHLLLNELILFHCYAKSVSLIKLE